MSDSHIPLPQTLTDAISENSPGGFILFLINPHGSPEVISSYDSDVSALALQKFALMWMSALEEAQSEAVTRSITNLFPSAGNENDDETLPD